MYVSLSVYNVFITQMYANVYVYMYMLVHPYMYVYAFMYVYVCVLTLLSKDLHTSVEVCIPP